MYATNNYKKEMHLQKLAQTDYQHLWKISDCERVRVRCLEQEEMDPLSEVAMIPVQYERPERRPNNRGELITSRAYTTLIHADYAPLLWGIGGGRAGVHKKRNERVPV